MQKILYLALLFAAGLGAQTAVWPNGVATDANLLVSANLCTTRLAQALADTTTTTLLVTNSSPSGTCFKANSEVQIDNEFMFVSAVAFGQLTVTRGFDNSTASTHQANAPVTVVPAAWYHNALRVEVEAIEKWLSSGGGSASGMIYNQGSTNAVNQTVTNRLQQAIWLTDFADNSGNPVSPSASAAVNNVGIQNAINWAAAHAEVLHCSGIYNISVPLIPPRSGEVQITGEGLSWTINTPAGVPGACQIKQTTPSAPIFSVKGYVIGMTLTNLQLTGGTNQIEFIQDPNGPPGNGGGAGPLILRYVSFVYYTHAGIYLDGYSLMQAMITDHCRWLAGANTANAVWQDAVSASLNPQPVGFLVGWSSTNDMWSGGTHAIYADSDDNSGGWTFTNPRFQDMYGTPVVLLGNIQMVSFRNFSMEATGAGDNGGSTTNPQWGTTTGTTTAANSSTIAVANGQYLGAGTTIHISQAGGTPGNYSYGIDFDTVIQSCTPACGTSGAVTLTVSPVIPNIVTGVSVTNSQSNGFEFLNSPVNTNLHPGYISFYDSLGCFSNYTIGDAGSCRYTIYNPSQTQIRLWGILQGAPIYDPYGTASPVSAVGTLMRTTPFDFVNSLVYPGTRAFDGNTLYPTMFAGNPGAKGGEFHWGCGDGNTTTFNSICASTGTYGNVTFMANHATRGRPAFTINYNTGTVAIGPNFNIAGAAANLAIGAGATPNGAANSIDLFNGTAPSSTSPGQGQIVQLGGVLYHYNPSGTAFNLDAPIASTNQLVTAAGPPSSSTVGAIGVNTTQGAAQVTPINGVQGSIPIVPGVSVLAGDTLCAAGNDVTIGKGSVTASAVSGSNTQLTVSGFTFPVFAGQAVTLSGSGDVGYNGNYSVVSYSGAGGSIVINLNSSSLAFTGAGTPILSLRCANSSDASTVTSFAGTYTAPANSFAAAGKQLSIVSGFEVWTSTTQNTTGVNMYWSVGAVNVWGNNGGTVTAALPIGSFFSGSMDITATASPSTTAPMIIGGGAGFALPGWTNSYYYAATNQVPTLNTANVLTFGPRMRWGASGAGGTITVAGSPSVTGSAGQYCLATATGTQLGGTGAVWYFVLTAANSVAGSQTFAMLPGANTGSGYTAVPTATWTLSPPVANAVSGIVPAAACSGIATATGGTLVGPMGNAIAQLTQRRTWYN